MSTDFIENVFSSRVRIKILRELIKHKEINITKLAKDVGINHKIAMYHVKALENLGIAVEKRFGRIRIIKLVENDPRVLALERLFMEIEGINDNRSQSV